MFMICSYFTFMSFRNWINNNILDWNMNQMTPYHFLQSLLAQGVVLSYEKVRVTESGQNTVEKPASQSIFFVFNFIDIREPYGGRSKSVKTTCQFYLTENNNLRQNEADLSPTNTGEFKLKSIDQTVIKKVRETSEYFCQISLLVLQSLKYPSSMVACSCVLAARKVCNIGPTWNKEMENLT
jgi:hypothetical protein